MPSRELEKEDSCINQTSIMKWNILTHNIQGLNDPDNIAKERSFLQSLTPRIDVVLIQEHKLRGRALENLGSRLMPGYASWILEAAPGERSWLNPNAAGKGGVGIILAQKYAKLVTTHGALYDNRVVWVKLEGIEGGNIGLACVYALNIPTERRHLWHLLVDYLPKDCEWIIGGDFNMTERAQDKSNDCGRAISEVERLTWNGLLNSFQLQDAFIHQRGPRFSWHNGQKGQARRLARLDRFYTPMHSRLGVKQSKYFIHGYSVGSDHSPVQLEVYVGEEGGRKSSFKWNISHLKGETTMALRDRWESITGENSFFQKLRNVTRFFRQLSIVKAKEFRKTELDARANLQIAIATLHDDIYNIDKQGEVSRLNNILGEIEARKTRGAM